ncbi:MAG: carbon-nitrogen hydrolase family protein [Actinomycetota bacterium]|nr:carbon-nitrogen hydrolase family protein [Actinomycetota bacterium]MDQ6910394.1 carbon-nitrogen hydrolase family protein [Actinomycetota bacterium]
MRVAAYQGPYLPFPSVDGVRLVAEQLAACEAAGVEILCCPEAIIGELANESDGDSPEAVAVGVENGELMEVMAPLTGSPVTVVVGFSERSPSGELFNSAAVLTGDALVGVYRKAYPGPGSAYGAGNDLPIFWHGTTPFGVLICNDVHHIEPARVLAARGATILLVPAHGGHRPAKEEAWRARGINVLVARAVENTVTVISADVAGRQGDRLSHGTTAIVDSQGTIVARAEPLAAGLLVAAVDVHPGGVPGAGMDGRPNRAVTEAFLELWRRE